MKQHGNSRVRPPVGPIHPLQRSAAGLLLGAPREVGDINRLQQAPGGWHEMRAVSRLQVPQKHRLVKFSSRKPSCATAGPAVNRGGRQRSAAIR